MSKNTLTKSEKILEIRAAIGVGQHTSGYFTVDEIKKVCTKLSITYHSFLNTLEWTDREKVETRWFNKADLDTLYRTISFRRGLLSQERPSTPTRLVPPSTESFGVVDAGLTDEETNLDSIYRMLPKAMTEEATYLLIQKDAETRRDLNGQAQLAYSNSWTVRVTFERN